MPHRFYFINVLTHTAWLNEASCNTSVQTSGAQALHEFGSQPAEDDCRSQRSEKTTKVLTVSRFPGCVVVCLMTLSVMLNAALFFSLDGSDLFVDPF